MQPVCTASAAGRSRREQEAHKSLRGYGCGHVQGTRALVVRELDLGPDDEQQLRRLRVIGTRQVQGAHAAAADAVELRLAQASEVEARLQQSVTRWRC